MINKLSIKNFQSHKDTTLDFVSGINAITGQSDSGKTAVIRALRWILMGKPTGDSIRRHDSKTTHVEIVLDNNTVISKTKTNKSTEYTALDCTYSAAGVDVPEDIKKIANVSDINIQKQMDSPFLLSETSGEVARTLNKIINIDKIDSSLKNIEQKKRELKRKIEQQTEELSSFEENLHKYDNIDKLETEISAMEDKQIEIDTSIVKIKTLKTIIDTITVLQERIQKYSKLTVHETEVQELLSIQEKITNTNSQYDTIKNIVTDTKSKQTALRETTMHLNELQKLLSELMPNVCPLCGRGNV